MAMQYKVVIALALILLLPLAATRTADGEVPTAVDASACNEQAPQAIKAGQAPPTTGDRARAERALADALTSPPPALTVIASPDPQIHGMEAEGAKNAAYQAAYRSCMRRKGF